MGEAHRQEVHEGRHREALVPIARGGNSYSRVYGSLYAPQHLFNTYCMAGTLLSTTYIILIASHRNFYHIHSHRSNGGLKTLAYLRWGSWFMFRERARVELHNHTTEATGDTSSKDKWLLRRPSTFYFCKKEKKGWVRRKEQESPSRNLKPYLESNKLRGSAHSNRVVTLKSLSFRKSCFQRSRIRGCQERAGKWPCLTCEAASEQQGGGFVPDLMAKKLNLCWHYLRRMYQVLLGEVTSVRKGSMYPFSKSPYLARLQLPNSLYGGGVRGRTGNCRHHLRFHHPVMKHLSCTLYSQGTSHCIHLLQCLLFEKILLGKITEVI